MSCRRFTHILVLPHLRVQNANAVSSPLTHGFPSMTAFLGLMWALERKAIRIGIALEFNAIGVVCHDHQEQTNSGDGVARRFNLARQGGSVEYTSVEEGRIHLDLSLMLAVYAEHWDTEAKARDLQVIADLVAGMRIAGGTLLPAASSQASRHRPWVADFTNPDDNDFRKLRTCLLPGTTLVARDDLIDTRLEALQAVQPEATRLDAWLSLSRVNWHFDANAENGKGAWQHDRNGAGWIVPMPVGYGALGPVHAAGSVPNARDATTPFRFVESLYSIGEWIGPHRLQKPQDLLWYADSQPDEGLYRCRNDYRATETTI